MPEKFNYLVQIFLMQTAFVCTGNRFRSMLAEALAMKNYPDESFESFGTNATRPIFDSVKQVVRENGLEEYVRYSPDQVSQESLEDKDRIICMKKRHRDFITERYDIDEDKIQVWGIPDADPDDNLQPIFEDIKQKVGQML